ncbi:MAG TPA: CRISPR-associated endonuclease Cas1 [Terriglobales bacterium]|nr:CRISPR-associated endonuclease Cas1 [Terriglobales bacterium]
MTALHTLACPPIVEQIGKHGILVMSGFGLRLKVQHGHLSAEWGIGAERHHVRLPRVNRNLRRVIVVGSDGFATFEAIRWITDIGASLVFLDRCGKLLFASGPTAPSDARLRRAQSLAIGNGVGVEVSRSLISAKLQGQERLVRERLKDSLTAQAVATFREKLQHVETVDEIRWLEAQAAIIYFGALRDIPVLWPKMDLSRIPEHWRKIGNRQSPLSGGPRLAITPFHCALNYCFALLESETRFALTAVGLDCGLGFGLHTDTGNRDSLALDVLEPVRPEVESWLVSWIMREPFRRADFFETATGNCRLMSGLCTRLAETSPTWGKLVAPWAEHVAHTLWATTSPSKSASRFPTRLTQRNKREAKGRPSFPRVKPAPQPESVCRVCGKSVSFGQSYCSECDAATARERIVEIAKVGRVASHAPGPKARRAETQRQHKLAISAWQPSSLPAWLNEQTYTKRIQPLLAGVANPVIMSALGVSVTYAVAIRAGRRRPHPRHWRALAELAGVSG